MPPNQVGRDGAGLEVDQYAHRAGHQSAPGAGGLQPAADLAVAVLRVEVQEEHSADQLPVQPQAVQGTGVGGTGRSAINWA